MSKKWWFAGAGFLAGVLGSKIAKSDTAKKISVKAVSQGLKAKESIDESIECFKENFDDVVAEAKKNNAQEAEEKRLKELALEEAEEVEESGEKAE